MIMIGMGVAIRSLGAVLVLLLAPFAVYGYRILYSEDGTGCEIRGGSTGRT